MKVECPQLKRKRHSGDKKKKSLMVTYDNSDSENSTSSNNEQANIYLMADIDENFVVENCSRSDTSSYASSNNEKDMPMMFFFKTHMVSLWCKKYKEKYKTFVFENTELKKSNDVLEKKI